MNGVWSAVALVISAAVGLLLGLGASWWQARRLISAATKEADQKRLEAERQRDDLRRQAMVEGKEEIQKEREASIAETREYRQEVRELEQMLRRREEQLDRKVEVIELKEENLATSRRDLQDREQSLQDRESALDRILQEQERRLQDISGMTRTQARNSLLDRLEAEVKKDAASIIKRAIDRAHENAELEAKRIIMTAIQRYAAEQVEDCTTSVVDLPNDDMKGRIIGRQGRNIRALERATGANLIVDDTPEAVTVSCFNPVRREIATRSLNRLVSDGRIHPSTIEEVVADVGKEVDAAIMQAGRDACLELDISDVHESIVEALGQLNFRTSYGQSVLRHSIEVASLAELMAAELGLDISIARRSALFHDLGKTLSQHEKGDHASLGASICRKAGESEEVVRAVETHHNRAPESIYAVLIQAADAISAARPGARSEILESYVRRLENLEEIALSFSGVQQAHALQAGRELRIIVEPEELSEADMMVLSRDLARRIEDEVQFPGEIKITAIRETRAVEYAR